MSNNMRTCQKFQGIHGFGSLVGGNMPEYGLQNTFPRVMANPKCRRIVHNSAERDAYIKYYSSFRNIYMSVYAFREIKQSLYETHQTALVDKVFIDIDDGDVVKTMKEIHKFLMNRNAIHRINLSGRGFHVFVWIERNLKYPKLALENYWDFLHGPTKCYDCGKPLTENYYCKECKKYVEYRNLFNPTKEFSSPKFGICPSTRGDLGRIFRYPNTKNFKADCYCIPIDNEIINKYNTIEEFQTFAENPYKPTGELYYGENLLDISDFDCNDELYEKMPIKHLTIGNISLSDVRINDNISFNLKDLPWCMTKMMETGLHFRERNEFIKFLINRADIEAPYMPEDIMGILIGLGEVVPHLAEKPKGILYRNIMIIFQNDEIGISCHHIQNLGYCNRKECKWKSVTNK